MTEPVTMRPMIADLDKKEALWSLELSSVSVGVASRVRVTVREVDREVLEVREVSEVVGGGVVVVAGGVDVDVGVVDVDVEVVEVDVEVLVWGKRARRAYQHNGDWTKPNLYLLVL
jgi:hypothetical protein